jgi:hypothetical protein
MPKENYLIFISIKLAGTIKLVDSTDIQSFNYIEFNSSSHFENW